MSQTRTSIGKIASLPHAIREELNTRLHDGESSKTLLPWLNGDPRVKSILAAQFHGHEINEENLSQWRLKGFKIWQQCQHRAEAAHAAQDEAAAAILEGASAGDITARVAIHACLTLDKLLTTLTSSGNLQDPATQSTVLEVVREIIQLRRLEVDAQKTRFQKLKWQTRASQSPAPVAQSPAKVAQPPSPASLTSSPDRPATTEEAALARTLYTSLKSALSGAKGQSTAGLDQG